MKVAPSVLSADFGNLQRDVESICKAGCDLVQGYYFSKPLSCKMVDKFLEDVME